MTLDVESDFERALLGLRVGGKYVVERVIGRGGMGCVALGRHEQLGQRVAIKFMLASAAGNQALHARFLREAQLAAKLQSDHVVRVFDVGSLDGGLPYMVMEYLEGGSLADELEAKGKLPTSVATDYVLQALEAIAEAHALGVVHRDLKPDNLFLARTRGTSRSVKVLDFGISKTAPGTEENHSLTQTTAILGSPLYMSPEQIRASKSVDARADIWSIGVVLYQLVEGTLPFEGESIGELFGKIQYVDPPAMQNAPPGFETVVRRCLTRDPNGRYANVRDLADHLQPFTSEIAERSLQVIHQVLTPVGPSPRVVVAVARAYSDPPPPVTEPRILELEQQRTLAHGAVTNEVRPSSPKVPRALVALATVGMALTIGLAAIGWTKRIAPDKARSASGLASAPAPAEIPLPLASRSAEEVPALAAPAASTVTVTPTLTAAASTESAKPATPSVAAPRNDPRKKAGAPMSSAPSTNKPAPQDSEPDRGF